MLIRLRPPSCTRSLREKVPSDRQNRLVPGMLNTRSPPLRIESTHSSMGCIMLRERFYTPKLDILNFEMLDHATLGALVDKQSSIHDQF